MKAFFLNIISGLKKFFLSRGFKKFISREFLILLLGGAIVGAASLYQDYDRDNIRNYNMTLNLEISKEINLLDSLIKPLKKVDKKGHSYGFRIYTFLEGKTNKAKANNDERRENLIRYGGTLSKFPAWVPNPTYSETFESFSEKFFNDRNIYFQGFGTDNYSRHIYDAMLYYFPKFNNEVPYNKFKNWINSSSDIAWNNVEPTTGLTYQEIKDKINSLESSKSPVRNSNLSKYFIDYVIMYTLIVLYGLRLLLYLIISSIRVLRKG